MRDYCPSRREQKKLKAKKIKARKIKTKRGRRSKKKSALINWQKIFFFVFSVFLLILFALLIFYLVRRQLIKRHQLDRNQHLLLTDNKQAIAWVVFAPIEQKIKVFDFSQLSKQSWVEEEPAVINANEELLFYSLIFNNFIDQVIDYPLPKLTEENQDQFAEFLLTELESRGAKDLAFYLANAQITWEWFGDDEADSVEGKQRLLENFLQKNTAVNYGKLFECPVAVVNSSQVSGLASAFAQLLEKDGFSVVRRDSGQDILEESFLLIDPNISACQNLAARFTQLVPNKMVTNDQELLKQYRSGAVIFMGEDLAQLRIRTFDFFHDGL
jgi:hypothetical protein